jgi:hypothetical protein
MQITGRRLPDVTPPDRQARGRSDWGSGPGRALGQFGDVQCCEGKNAGHQYARCFRETGNQGRGACGDHVVTAGMAASLFCRGILVLVMMVHGGVFRRVLPMFQAMRVAVHRLHVATGHCRHVCGKTLHGQGKQQDSDQQCTQAIHRRRVYVNPEFFRNYLQSDTKAKLGLHLKGRFPAGK